jgi:hypothetical protein
MTQEWYFLDLKLTYAKLGVKLVLPYSLEVLFRFFHTLQIYRNVVNEHHDKLVQLCH